MFPDVDVRRHKDTNFWKQFTTYSEFESSWRLMFAVTKIQIFESNSQLSLLVGFVGQWCSPSQRYKFLKAIHNTVEGHEHLTVMFAVTKIQIFESNSQLSVPVWPSSVRCSPSQRYKFLKAIHNLGIHYDANLFDVRRHKDTNFWKQFTTKEDYNKIL